jgi:alpha-D-ribose 1-methylphosphonate 5-triphosphate synthase subunit PhnG
MAVKNGSGSSNRTPALKQKARLETAALFVLKGTGKLPTLGVMTLIEAALKLHFTGGTIGGRLVAGTKRGPAGIRATRTLRIDATARTRR